VSAVPDPELAAAERALGALPLLDALGPAEVHRLAAIAEPFALEAGEYLYREGDDDDCLYLIEAGSIQLGSFPPAGPGEVVGEMAALARLPRQVPARALERSSGWSIDATAVGELTGASGAIGLARGFGVRALDRLRTQYDALSKFLDDDKRIAVPPRPSSLDIAGPVLPADPELATSEYMRTILFFSAFNAEETDELFGDLRRLEAPRGAMLVLQNERPGALLAVLRGAVETTIRHGGAAVRARLSGPGRFAGHLGVLDDGPSPVTCRARERTILLELPAERVRALVDDPARSARHFTRGLYADVVEALFQAQRPMARMAARGG
jgi:CRP-like cAMP-binding protein